MPHSSSLVALARWLAGEFENRSQAAAQPVWFVHLRLWHRPLPFLIQEHLGLFAEQANVLYLDQPYRQRVLLLEESNNQLTAQYLAFKQPTQICGAGADPARLQSLTLEDLDWLPGCVLQINQQENRFVAQPEPDTKCFFEYDGKSRQVILGFEVSQERFLSYDRGVDPDTGQGLWGALMGPYEFQRQQDFSSDWGNKT
jgi:hypothetical protein